VEPDRADSGPRSRRLHAATGGSEITGGRALLGWVQFVWILAAVEVLILFYYGYLFAPLSRSLDAILLSEQWRTPNPERALWSSLRWINLIAVAALWRAARRGSGSRAAGTGRAPRASRRWVLLGWAVVLATFSLATRSVERIRVQSVWIERMIDCSVDPCQELRNSLRRPSP
jgi:hypothetical protein